MELKYQALIDSQGLTIQCPPEGCQVNEEIGAARWAVSPLGNALNFLPNHLYNSNRGAPPRILSEEMRCGYCSLSFHTSIEASKVAFHNMTPQIQKKLGYTHVAVGAIRPGWGLVTKVSEVSQHFELFERDGCDWMAHFQLADPL